MAPLIDELLQLWSRRCPAVSWAPEWNDFSILVWADNIFLTTDSAAEAARRSCEVASVFKSQRLYFNESSLEILPSKAAEKDSFPFGLKDGESFTWVETLQVLGCFLDSTGSTETLAKGRLLQEINPGDFESALVRMCGDEWKDLANVDHQLWLGQRPAFVAEAVRIWGGPRLVCSVFCTLTVTSHMLLVASCFLCFPTCTGFSFNSLNVWLLGFVVSCCTCS